MLRSGEFPSGPARPAAPHRGPIIGSVSDGGAGYCISCGAALGTEQRFCMNCGRQRWEPEREAAPRKAERLRWEPPTAQPERRPPGSTAGAGGQAHRAARIGLLPWFYAAGAVFLLVQATQLLAYYASSVGRAQQLAALASQGVAPQDRPVWLVLEAVIPLVLLLSASAIHALAFYGLRGGRRWGWLAAVVVAALWSLLIVGIPVLLRLTRREVRRAYGVD